MQSLINFPTSAERMKLMAQKGFMNERNIHESRFIEHGIEVFVERNELIHLVAYVKPYVKNVVLEFYVCLQKKPITNENDQYFT